MYVDKVFDLTSEKESFRCAMAYFQLNFINVIVNRQEAKRFHRNYRNHGIYIYLELYINST